MALVKHLEDAADRLKKAATQVEEARGQPVTPEHTRVWLEALTEYVFALSALQDLTTEALEEKLEELRTRQRQAGRGAEV